MGMFKLRKRNLYRNEIKNIMKAENLETADEVLDLLFGSYCNDFDSDYVVHQRYIDVKSTFMNRVNRLWVTPVYFVFIAPFRYLAFGYVGVNRDTKFGQIMEYLLGDL